VRHYTSPSFGFASRNFYVSFLAALEIDRNPEKYFGHIRRDPEVRFQEVSLPVRASVSTLERVLGMDADTLRALNPALRPVCWRGRRPVPKGYHLRLPVGGMHWTTALLAQRLGVGAPHILLAKADAPRRGPAEKGEALASIEARPVPLAPATVPAGAAPAPKPTPAHGSAPAGPGGGVSPETARIESDEDTVAVAAIAAPASKAQPVSAAQAEALGPALGPAAVAETAAADPIDYSVSKNDTIVVAAAETLGHYADWLQVSATRLRKLNHLRHRSGVVMGHRIKLDFHRVSPEVFEAKRREYHRSIEASYFAAHRIAGTEVYIARRGDSLWTVTQRYERLPIWLLQQYNPDVDFSDMRPGTQIVVPRIEDVASSGG
jgi:membrane-bound lytic murein transglycosylase D